MRCCIQNCFNDNDDPKKTNKSKGLTFHKIPSAPDHSAAWMQAITNLGCRMNKNLLVCSEHFLLEDFVYTRHNQRRVKSGVVPTIVAPVIQEDFKMCRVCLSLDVKVYDMKDYKLNEMFQNITGILDIGNKRSIVQQVCWECAARLKAAAAFRERALLSDALLEGLVPINKTDIAKLKQNHTSLKSPLIVHTAFTYNIASEHSISENKKINIFLPNNQPDVKERTTIRVNQEEKETGFQEYDPLIDAPIKIKIESDPIADNDNEQDRKLFADSLSPREDSEDETSNTKVKINDNGKNLSVNAYYEVPIINFDDNIVLANDNNQSSLNETVTIEDESSSAEDSESTSDDVDNKSKNNEVGASNEKGITRNHKINDALKEKIISMKNNGCSVSDIAEETGLTVSSIICFWRRYRKNGFTYRRTITPRKNRTKQNHQHNAAEPGKDSGSYSEIVRQRLCEAGFEHILMKKPEESVNEEEKTSEHKAHHEDLKRRIIALKQEGLGTNRIAYLLNTTRNTVAKWWDRWCKEGHMQNQKKSGRKRKTTPEEDQLILQRVMDEQSLHTPSLAMEFGLSPKMLRKRLKEAGFKRKTREAYVPFKAGRNHKKFDEELKQRILSMKLNGVSVTDIANQFRVPRTTIYDWWQRWCKENNVKGTSDNNTSTATEDQGSTERAHEKSLQTPAIISSQKSLWEKLPEGKPKQE